MKLIHHKSGMVSADGKYTGYAIFKECYDTENKTYGLYYEPEKKKIAGDFPKKDCLEILMVILKDGVANK